MIELSAVTRHFDVGGQRVHALRSTTLTIADGDYVAIMGPSGSGKSTLLNVLGCLDRPSSGAYLLNGRDVGTWGERELSVAVRPYRGGNWCSPKSWAQCAFPIDPIPASASATWIGIRPILDR